MKNRLVTNVLLSGVAALSLGMALYFAGIVVPGTILPALILINAGLAGCAAAGVVAVVSESRNAAGAKSED
ncbi:MAG TPA: hypothetical protein VNZ57_09245 [Longimicrobiales bacterium]|nr:hypothetical protein [Longimicrobiales bacterium]